MGDGPASPRVRSRSRGRQSRSPGANAGAAATRGESTLQSWCGQYGEVLLQGLSLSGEVGCEVKGEPLQTIESVKGSFARITGTPQKHLRLVFGERELCEAKTLEEEGLVEAATGGVVRINIIRCKVEAPSLLDLAKEEDDPRLAPFLIECGADPNETDELGWTALHWNVHYGHTAVCESVLARPDFVSADAQDIGKMTALHAFAQHGHAALCKVIAARPDFTKLNARGPNGNTALHWAARNGHEAVCEALLGLPAFTAVSDQNFHGWTALHYAAAAGMRRVCERILSHPCFHAAAEVTNNGETALHWAALNGRLEVCRLLLRDGRIDASLADVEGMVALDGARAHGHEAVCNLLRAGR